MKFDFELVLDDCLAQMRAGKTLEECLQAHPAQAEKLRPLLQSASQVWELPIPRAHPAAFQAGLERLLAGAKLQQVSPAPVSSGPFARYTQHIVGTLKTSLYGKTRSSLNLALRLGAALVLVLFTASTVMVRASAASLPGDSLYQIKRNWETVRLSLTPNQQSKQQLLDQFAGERREEVKELIQLRRAGTVEFEAPLEEMDAQHWRVDGFQVQIDPETDVEGTPETGASVDIHARLAADGTLYAIQVQVPAGTKPSPYPTASPTPSPTPGFTPQSEEDSETEASEANSHPKTPGETQLPTEVEANQQNKATIQPAQPSETEATRPPQSHPERSAEPTEKPEMMHTPEPTETHTAAHSPEPTHPRSNP